MDEVPGLNQIPGDQGKAQPAAQPSPATGPASQPVDFRMNRPTIISLRYNGRARDGLLVGIWEIGKLGIGYQFTILPTTNFLRHYYPSDFGDFGLRMLPPSASFSIRLQFAYYS